MDIKSNDRRLPTLLHYLISISKQLDPSIFKLPNELESVQAIARGK